MLAIRNDAKLPAVKGPEVGVVHDYLTVTKPDGTTAVAIFPDRIAKAPCPCGGTFVPPPTDREVYPA